MKLSILISMILLSLHFTSFAQSFLWAKNFGGPSGNVEGHSLTVDNLGNVYTLGTFTNTVDFDPNSGVYNVTASPIDDIFIQKLDALGNFVWVKQIGIPAPFTRVFSIASDPTGNLFIVGQFSGTIDFDPGPAVFNLTPTFGGSATFILKLDTNGNFKWVKTMDVVAGFGHVHGRAICSDNSGNVYTTGFFENTVDFDPNSGISNLTAASNDLFILKLDSNGNYVWAKGIGSVFDKTEGKAISVDNSGNVYTTGYYSTPTDFDPGTGVFTMNNLDYSDDIFVLKLNSSGNFVWAKSMGGSSQYDLAYDITVDGIGNVYTTGVFSGTADFDPGPGISNLTGIGTTNNNNIFISKLDVNGDFVWAKQMGGSGTDVPKSIRVDGNGNVYTTGYFQNTVDFDPGPGILNFTSTGPYDDIYIQKLDAAGNLLWAANFDGGNRDRGHDLALDNLGNVYTTGYFRQTIDFNPGFGTNNLTTVGSRDAFVLKVNEVSVLGMKNLEEVTIKMYPNPTSGLITIDLGNTTDVSITAYNLLGRIVYQKENINTSTFEFELTGATGVYFIEVCSKETKNVFKLKKQ